MKGEKSHQNVEDALTMLVNMEHRGACGCDPNTGDGAGILIQIPDKFFREVCDFKLPDFGEYGVGMVFFPQDEERRIPCKELLIEQIDKLGFHLLGFRPVPNDPIASSVGKDAMKVSPYVEQLFVAPKQEMTPDKLERKLFVLRRIASHKINNSSIEVNDDFYFTSLSYKTIVYKGQFRTDQVQPYFPDLYDKRVESALALVHSRFSTNTFPQWRLAQPFRYIAHNGEINTIRGNVNWMQSKETLMKSPLFKESELKDMLPICNINHSDSRNLDSIVELLVMSGRSLPHVMMMVIPEAWQ
ncbi:UNVERIFIED_CONTAM: hypothetical protein GTU68_048418, partial [Idotea baltica]|nr:hypothetical protein [Idotea baltica]